MRFLIPALALLFAGTADALPFGFIAFGDTAYQLPRDAPRLERLIDAINRERPAFSIHVGDFKGYTSCSDAAYLGHKAVLQRLQQPLVLTPGDNDWTDCSVESAGSFDPLERLSSMRRIFFSGPQSLGARPMPLIRQSATYPENASWTRDGLVFATVHLVGPHNGLVMNKALAAEAIDRSETDAAWIRQAFHRARDSKAPALVLAFQLDPWIASAPRYEDGPIAWLVDLIGEEAATYSGQVLVIHGDSHRLTIDTPYRRVDPDRGTTRALNVTRLMVPGWPDTRAVRVDVDTSRPEVFGFRVVMDPEEAQGAKP